MEGVENLDELELLCCAALPVDLGPERFNMWDFDFDLAKGRYMAKTLLKLGPALKKIGLEAPPADHQNKSPCEPASAKADEHLEQGVSIKTVVDKVLDLGGFPLRGAQGLGALQSLKKVDFGALLGEAEGDGVLAKILAGPVREWVTQEKMAGMKKALPGPDILAKGHPKADLQALLDRLGKWFDDQKVNALSFSSPHGENFIGADKAEIDGFQELFFDKESLSIARRW